MINKIILIIKLINSHKQHVTPFVLIYKSVKIFNYLKWHIKINNLIHNILLIFNIQVNIGFCSFLMLK